MAAVTVAYISIGNSDDRLTQARWSFFYSTVALTIQRAAEADGGQVHGQWVSEPASAWQNACWALQLPTDSVSVEHLKMRLSEIAADFSQEAIAWAEAPMTEFLPGVVAGAPA